jgi:AcrR family transcriptional regulator
MMTRKLPKISEQKKSDRRAQILDATIKLLLENGLAATRTRDVTELSGVGTGLLNHYFRWTDLRAEAWSLIFAAVADESFPFDVNSKLVLEQFFSNAFALESEKYWRLWIEATEMAKQDEAIAKAIVEAQFTMEEGLAKVLSTGNKAGHWKLVDSKATALRLSALHDGLAGFLLSGAIGLNRKKAESHLRHAFALECQSKSN